MKERISLCLSPPLPHSLPHLSSCLLFCRSALLSSCGPLLSLLLRAIYAKAERGDVRLCSRSLKTRLCLSSEEARLRLNPSPPGNQEVGGPHRERSSNSSTQAVSHWMNRSLSAAWERMERGSCVATTGIRQSVNGRQALQLVTQPRRAYTS